MTDGPYFTYPISSWDNDVRSTSLDPSQTIQNAPSLSLGRKQELVPVSRYTSQSQLPYNNDERRIQQYQSSKPLIETSQPTPVTKSKFSLSKWWKKHMTITHFIGLLVGMIICGVPLIVMITLYAQYSASSSSATGTSTALTTISTSFVLPYQCTSYSPNTDSTRNVGYSYCCYCDSGMTGWYRFTAPAGTRLVTSPIPAGNGYCGATMPGWFNGTLPTIPGTTTMGIECINYNGYVCNPSYSTATVLATNCNGFYVFYLSSLPICNSRYCTI